MAYLMGGTTLVYRNVHSFQRSKFQGVSVNVSSQLGLMFVKQQKLFIVSLCAYV